jgi:hypothetical protein
LKTLETLISDIDTLFTSGRKVSSERAEELGQEIASLVVRALARPLEEDRGPTLRMSNLGKPDRQIWYEHHTTGQKEELNGTTLRKFLMGDLWEALLLWLAEEAGHEVSGKQLEVDVDGIKGHIDAVVDGVVVDVKSASTYSFRKFKNGTLAEDDPFGYYEQLAGYSNALGLDGAWLAVDKQTGALTVLEAPKEELDALDIRARVSSLREVLQDSEPPPRCYDPVADGKSGNLALSVGCSYCPFKHKCWEDANHGAGIRTFVYSTGPKFLVHVEREPNTPETF